MNAVIGQIHSLGRLAQKLPGYAGPTLGVKEATNTPPNAAESTCGETSAEISPRYQDLHTRVADGAQATANRRSFTEAQLAEARNTTTFLGKGSAGTAAAGMSKIETGKQQVCAPSRGQLPSPSWMSARP